MFDLVDYTTLKIRISAENYSYLIVPSNNNSEIYLPANISFINRKTQLQINNVGMRDQGKFSRRFLKHSWKLKLDHFVKDNQFFQIDEFYLKGGCDDPALLREVLSRKLLYMFFFFLILIFYFYFIFYFILIYFILIYIFIFIYFYIFIFIFIFIYFLFYLFLIFF